MRAHHELVLGCQIHTTAQKRHCRLLWVLRKMPPPESFKGSSYYLEGLLHLAVRTEYKQTLKSIFPEVTRIAFKAYLPDVPWKWYLINNKSAGTNLCTHMSPPHRWSDLYAIASESLGEHVPSRLHDNHLLYLCMLIVMPYRVSASGLRWLDSKMNSL